MPLRLPPLAAKALPPQATELPVAFGEPSRKPTPDLGQYTSALLAEPPITAWTKYGFVADRSAHQIAKARQAIAAGKPWLYFHGSDDEQTRKIWQALTFSGWR
jgi:hypothetical protein